MVCSHWVSVIIVLGHHARAPSTCELKQLKNVLAQKHKECGEGILTLLVYVYYVVAIEPPASQLESSCSSLNTYGCITMYQILTLRASIINVF